MPMTASVDHPGAHAAGGKPTSKGSRRRPRGWRRYWSRSNPVAGVRRSVTAPVASTVLVGLVGLGVVSASISGADDQAMQTPRESAVRSYTVPARLDPTGERDVSCRTQRIHPPGA